LPFCAIYFGFKSYPLAFAIYALALLGAALTLHTIAFLDINQENFRSNRDWVDREDNALVIALLFLASLCSVILSCAVYAISAWIRRKRS